MSAEFRASTPCFVLGIPVKSKPGIAGGGRDPKQARKERIGPINLSVQSLCKQDPMGIDQR